MKSFCFYVTLILFVFCSSCTKTQYVQVPVAVSTGGSGNEGGNGGDSITSLNRGAWFLTEYQEQRDSRPIRVCLSIAKGFGYEETEAQEVVEFAFGEWKKYILLQNINLSVGSKKYRPSTALEWVSCEKQVDLKFYLGVENEETAENRKRFLNPLAYAWQTKVDSDSGWGAGFIWVAPPNSVRPKYNFPLWKQDRPGQLKEQSQSQLRQILLHEIGHVLGCDHVPGTIMRADIQNYLMNDLEGSKYRDTYLKSLLTFDSQTRLIEHERLLMFSRSGEDQSSDQDSQLDVTKMLRNQGRVFEKSMSTLSIDAQTHQLLFGYEPSSHEWGYSDQTAVTTTFLMQEGGKRNYLLSYMPKKALLLKSLQVHLMLDVAPIKTRETLNVFKMQLGDTLSSYSGDGAEFYSGQIILRGRFYDALVHRDLDNTPTSIIWIVVKGKRIRLN